MAIILLKQIIEIAMHSKEPSQPPLAAVPASLDSLAAHELQGSPLLFRLNSTFDQNHERRAGGLVSRAGR